eukprot:2080318-Karenia_brevis.AAC.1
MPEAPEGRCVRSLWSMHMIYARGAKGAMLHCSLKERQRVNGIFASAIHVQSVPQVVCEIRPMPKSKETVAGSSRTGLVLQGMGIS